MRMATPPPLCMDVYMDVRGLAEVARREPQNDKGQMHK